MSPFSFEWHWNPDYLIFMGLLYLALTVIACGLIYAFLKTWMDLCRLKDHEPGEPLPSRRCYSAY